MRLVCDVMLGKLAKYLRLLGFDAVYLRDVSQLKSMDESEKPCIFITRRAKFAGCRGTLIVHCESAREQVIELKDHLKPLIDRPKVLNRCIECNVPLEEIDRTDVEHRVPEFVYHHYNKFKECTSCRRVYWEGSHAKRMNDLLKDILD